MVVRNAFNVKEGENLVLVTTLSRARLTRFFPK
jgi:hypothetical protein